MYHGTHAETICLWGFRGGVGRLPKRLPSSGKVHDIDIWPDLPVSDCRQPCRGILSGSDFALATVGIGFLLYLLPDHGASLQLTRQGLALHPWQLVSGHLVHWSPSHLAGNACALLLLARLAGERAPPPMWALAGLLLCSATMIAALPDLAFYRGSSTLVAIHLMPAAATLWQRGGRPRRAAAVLVAVYLAHLLSQAFGLDSSPLLPANVRSTWELHLLGLGWGGIGLLLPQRNLSSRPSS